MVTALDHPAYSPDLSPLDYSLFPKMKVHLEGQKFNTIPETEANVTTKLKTAPQKQFLKAMLNMKTPRIMSFFK